MESHEWTAKAGEELLIPTEYLQGQRYQMECSTVGCGATIPWDRHDYRPGQVGEHGDGVEVCKRQNYDPVPWLHFFETKSQEEYSLLPTGINFS